MTLLAIDHRACVRLIAQKMQSALAGHHLRFPGLEAPASDLVDKPVTTLEGLDLEYETHTSAAAGGTGATPQGGTFTARLSIVVADALTRADAFTLERAVSLVCQALGNNVLSDETAHTMWMLGATAEDVGPLGEDARSRMSIVTVTGIVFRTAGFTFE